MKGLAVFGVFYFLRREFDGVVDGVIYATFVALGFAATENIIYYSNAVKADPQGSALAATFVLRGVLAPWGHPLYTSMTGIGFGISRETNRTWLKWMAPIGRLLRGDVPALHVEHGVDHQRVPLPGHAAAVAPLRGRVHRHPHLARRAQGPDHPHAPAGRGAARDDHARGARASCARRWAGCARRSAGAAAAGRKFVRTAARLGLSKWHAGRAMKGRKTTVSADWIVPLRQELAELRMEVVAVAGPAGAACRRRGRPPAQQAVRAAARRRRTRSKAAIRSRGRWRSSQPQQAAAPYNQYPPHGWGRR